MVAYPVLGGAGAESRDLVCNGLCVVSAGRQRVLEQVEHLLQLAAVAVDVCIDLYMGSQ